MVSGSPSEFKDIANGYVIRSVKSNLFGVLDHVVKLSASLEIKNPMRVIPNGNGSKGYVCADPDT